MNFPISGTHIHPLSLIVVGFLLGLLGGFFGVGGGFLSGPLLFWLGVPMNFVVGTSAAQIVGKSVIAARKHWSLGNIDLKLGAIMMPFSLLGVELGKQMIQALKPYPHLLNQIVGNTYIIVLLSISGFMAWEGWQTLRSIPTARSLSPDAPPTERDQSTFARFTRRAQGLGLPPYLSLPKSGIARISLWPIILVSLVGGVFSGFLGAGGGFIRMPTMIYLLGIPTHIAVGTDLFEVIISAGFSTYAHAIDNNVDIMIALVMQTGAAIGAQFGATLTQYITGPRIRLAFVPLTLLGAIIMIYKLLHGAPLK